MREIIWNFFPTLELKIEKFRHKTETLKCCPVETFLKQETKEKQQNNPINFLSYLFVELDISKDWMNPPGFREHRPKGEREPGHEDPGLDSADVSEGRLWGERRVQAEDDDPGVAEETAHYYQVIQVRRRHLDLPDKNFNILIDKLWNNMIWSLTNANISFKNDILLSRIL